MIRHIYFRPFQFIFSCLFLVLINQKSIGQGTVYIDLQSLTTSYENGTQSLAIPVYYANADQINALDFWFQFNTTKLTYTYTLTNQLNADQLSNFNVSNEFLSNTTSSSGIDDYFVQGLPLVTLYFLVNDPCSEILASDFFAGEALLNGSTANLIWSTPEPQSYTIAINTPSPFCVGSSIEFEFATVINGQQITNYNWDLIGSSGTTNIVNTSYTSAGSFSPSLTATTEAGCIFNNSTELNIQPGPSVSFTSTGLAANTPTVFNNTTTFFEGNITGYSWNFGDNSTSTETNPSHIYLTDGIYEVQLQADGDNGCSTTLTQEISITSDILESLPSALLIYPNPAKDHLMVSQQQITSLRLFNGLGQRITTPLVYKTNQLVQLDLTHLESGLYFIEIAPSLETVKFIIE